MIRTAQLNLAKWPVTEPYLDLVVISHALVARLALPNHYGNGHLWYIGAWDKKVPPECAELHKHQGIQKNTKNKMLSEKHGGGIQHFKLDELFQWWLSYIISKTLYFGRVGNPEPWIIRWMFGGRVQGNSSQVKSVF